MRVVLRSKHKIHIVKARPATFTQVQYKSHIVWLYYSPRLLTPAIL